MVRKVKPRLATTGKKVRAVIGLIYLEDMCSFEGCDDGETERRIQHTYGELLCFLDSLHCECCVSPVHDRDKFTSQDVWDWCSMHIDPETGDLAEKYIDQAPYVGKPKKPHVHLYVKTGGQQLNAQQWTELFEPFCYVRPTIWDQPVSFTGIVRYMAHMDSPNKAQYSPMDIHGFGGIDLSCLVKVDDTRGVTLSMQVHDLIKVNRITYFYQLVDCAYETADLELVSYVKGSSGMWAAYLSSKSQHLRDKEQSTYRKRKLAKIAS